VQSEKQNFKVVWELVADGILSMVGFVYCGEDSHGCKMLLENTTNIKCWLKIV